MAAVPQLLLSALPSSAGIAFRSVGTLASGTGTITPGLPAGVVTGDLLVYVVMSGNGVPTTPTGYSTTNSNTTASLCIFTRVAGAGEIAHSTGTVGGGASATVAQVFAYSGVNATPIDVQMVADNATGITSSITTTAANTFVLSVYGSTSGSATWSAPASTNVRATNNPNGTINGLLLVDESKAVAGATTTRTATGPVGLASFAFAIKP